MTMKQGGFSLMEAVLVLAIIGVLAAMFAPRYVDVKQKAHEVVNQTEYKQHKMNKMMVDMGLCPLYDIPNKQK